MELFFQEFKNRGAKSPENISLTRSASFGFSYGFCKKHNLTRFRYVVLFYDKKNRAVGFLFTNNKKRKNKYKINHSPSGKSAHVVAKAFIRAHRIDPKTLHGHYKPQIYEQTDIGKLFYIQFDPQNPS